MRHHRFHATTINTGSMADIAFLLLIFFLVTAAIPNDQGFNRKLPKPCVESKPCIEEVNERNILRIIINSKNQILVEDQLTSIENLKNHTINFLDNNGDGSCSYCNGLLRIDSSDNPQKAIISLQTHPSSIYDKFIKVQDELTKAYYELRKRYTHLVLNKKEDELTETEIIRVKASYPFIISEAITRE